MTLHDIIDPATASLVEASAVHTAIHKLFRVFVIENARLLVVPDVTAAEVLDRIYDILRDLDTESRYLVEDILEEMEEADNA